MKKKSKPLGTRAMAASGEGGTCSYVCEDGTFNLAADNSEPGYHCDSSYGACNEDETTEVPAVPDESGEGGTCSYVCDNGTFILDSDNSEPGYHCDSEYGACSEDETVEVPAIPDGGGEATVVGPVLSQSLRVRSMALPKNSALYEFHGDRKVLRRMRGAWAKGHCTPLEMTLKELAKFAPKVYEIVKAMAKNRSVVSFQVVVPSQKMPSKKKGIVAKKGTAKQGAVAKKEAAKLSKPVAAKPVAAKKAKPKKKPKA